MKTLTAVIPVRAGSKRLKNKNILPFGDSNLLVHKIRQLKQVKGIDRIVVSSDSDEMLQMAKDECVYTHKRPVEYCDEQTKSFNEVVEYIALSQNADSLMWAPCVCPLTSVSSYEKGIDVYNKLVISKQLHDSLISVKSVKEYIFQDGKAFNFLPDKHVPSQLLPDWQALVNGFFIAPREVMIERKYIYGLNPYLYQLDKKEAIDIDDEDDFLIAKALLGVE